MFKINKLKLLIILLGVFVNNVYSQQSDVFKCVDENGGITYSNTSNNGVCQKTSLGNIDKGKIINKVNSNQTQSDRDQKRASILNGELLQEKAQLESVQGMLRKTTDPEQLKKLNEMNEVHKRNVNALQKELGKNADVELLLPSNIKQNDINKTIPIGLPTEPTKTNDNKGLLSEIIDTFKNKNTKSTEDSTTQPQTNVESKMNIETNTDNVDTIKRVPLETNLITNKSIKKGEK